MNLRSVTDDAEVQQERLRRASEQERPDALIAVSIRPDPDTIAAYGAANIPIILIDEEAPGVSAISTDNFMGGRLAGEHLISKKRKRIAIVSGKTQVKGGYNAELRLAGFRHALEAAKLPLPRGHIIEVVNYSREEGIEVMPKLLAVDVDGIFCAAGDNCATGLIAVARERGVRIPEQVAIVGFDDLLIAQLSTPTLTTIKQPLEKIAEAAYKMAIIDGPELLRKPQKIVFTPELVIRQSA
jgi:DNA-binding LacI/PurR family transcriptional regulator